MTDRTWWHDELNAIQTEIKNLELRYSNRNRKIEMEFRTPAAIAKQKNDRIEYKMKRLELDNELQLHQRMRKLYF